MLLNVGSGGGAAAAPSSGGAGGAVAAAPAEEAKEEKEEGMLPSIPDLIEPRANDLSTSRKRGIRRRYGIWAFRLVNFPNQCLCWRKIPMLQQ